MKNKSFIKDLQTLVPLVFSGLLCMVLIYILTQKLSANPEFGTKLDDLSTLFIAISGFLSVFIMAYLIYAASGLKTHRSSAISNLSLITQQMHSFRSIVELLIRSKLWLPGLKEYIDDEFAGLNFFEVKEFYKGKSKLAIEFLQESHDYGDTENLYLELKSLLMTSVKDKRIPENLEFPEIYRQEIVEKWLEHKCGSGLWYYFGYKYAVFKEALDFNSVFERHQEKIMTLAHSIDSEAFEDSSFNEVFLSRLGEYMTKEIIPKLHQFQGKAGKKMPHLLKYLYLLFALLTIAGVLLPIVYLLFNITALALIVSFSMVTSLIFFMATTFYQFLDKEINS
jgi:hypothetical protein